MGLVTVITSGKGGAGKSTVSVGLGCTLAKNGKRVLLIDGDAGLRSLDAMLGVDKELVFDISDIVNGNCEPIKAIYSCEEYKQPIFAAGTGFRKTYHTSGLNEAIGSYFIQILRPCDY